MDTNIKSASELAARAFGIEASMIPTPIPAQSKGASCAVCGRRDSPTGWAKVDDVFLSSFTDWSSSMRTLEGTLCCPWCASITTLSSSKAAPGLEKAFAAKKRTEDVIQAKGRYSDFVYHMGEDGNPAIMVPPGKGIERWDFWKETLKNPPAPPFALIMPSSKLAGGIGKAKYVLPSAKLSLSQDLYWLSIPGANLLIHREVISTIFDLAEEVAAHVHSNPGAFITGYVKGPDRKALAQIPEAIVSERTLRAVLNAHPDETYAAGLVARQPPKLESLFSSKWFDEQGNRVSRRAA